MMRQWCSIARVAALATAALLFAAGPSLAQHGGHGGGHAGGGHAGGGHAGGFSHGGVGGSFSHGGYSHGGVHDGFHHGGFDHRGFYGFGLGLGLGYPWYWGGYGYYPGYYDSWYYGDYGAPAYAPGYYDYSAAPDSYANAYSYPAVQVPPQNPSLATAPQNFTPPNENAVYVRVKVPPDAEVWFEGEKTTQTGPVRFFESPSLTPGRKYVYHIKARWTENGRQVEQTRDVPVYAGDKFSVDFTKMEQNPPAKPNPPAGS